MSKTTKKIFTLIGVAALALTGIGMIVAPAIWTTAGALATIAGDIGITTLLSIASASLSIGLAPDPPSVDDTGANGRGSPYADPNAVGAYVFGRTTVPVSLLTDLDHEQA